MCMTLECFGMKYICCSILTTVSCSVIISYSVSMSWFRTSYAWYAAAYSNPVKPLWILLSIYVWRWSVRFAKFFRFCLTNYTSLARHAVNHATSWLECSWKVNCYVTSCSWSGSILQKVSAACVRSFITYGFMKYSYSCLI